MRNDRRMTLALRPDLEAWLAEEAERNKMSRHGYVVSLIERQRYGLKRGAEVADAIAALPPEQAEAERLGIKANAIWRDLVRRDEDYE